MTVQSFTIATMHLSEATFVVVDLETSGAAPSTGAGITEIGAVKVRGGVVIGEFETFVIRELKFRHSLLSSLE